jgi:hypothetical protein
MSEMNIIPIIYLHWGNCNYLQRTTIQTLKHNDIVIFLGDNKINKYYYENCKKFTSVYEHMSHVSQPLYEMRCMLRWIIIYNFMQTNGIDKIFYCDSDVCLYTDISKEWFINEDMCVMEAQREDTYGCASGHSSLWSIDALREFNKFLIDCYTTDKKEELIRRRDKHIGNVCDMMLIYLFGKEYKHTSLTQVFNNSTFDDNLGSHENLVKDEYMIKGDMKDIKFINGIPYCYNKILNKYIKFNSIHYCGLLKYKIPNPIQRKINETILRKF